MKKYINKSGMLALFACLLFTSCDPEIDAPSASAGEADFTKYVAVGNSLTAGFADGGLYREGQLNSYPAILAQQFELVGGGDFVQPLFSEAQRNGSGYLRLGGFSTTGSPLITRVTTELAVRTDVAPLPGGPRLTKYTDTDLINNYGVPGMSVLSSATPLFAFVNPFFERILTDAEVGTKTYIAEVAESQPTFFTLWLGNNDILTYATNGAVADLANPFGNKTDITLFKQIYTGLVAALSRGGEAEGVIANIPDVTSIPFFKTVSLASIRQAAGDQSLVLYVKVGPAPTDVRPLEAADLVTLSTQAAIGRVDQVATPGGPVSIPHGFHPANPLNDNEVLDKDEVVEVQEYTEMLNEAIAEVAAANQIPVFDVNEYFNTRFSSPYVLNGVTYTAGFISGNVFSLDGIHLTPRGNALVANEFIRVINNAYNANIPSVDETQYRTVIFP